MTKQLTLFTPKRPKPPKAPALWGVWLNEVRLYHAAPHAMNWWMPFRRRFETNGKVRTIDVTLGGEVIQIGPYTDRDDADFIVTHLIEQGVPQSAVKTLPWPATPAPQHRRPDPPRT